MDFPDVSGVKNLPANAGVAGEAGSTPESGRSPGVGNSNPLWYSCLKNPMDRGVCWATVHGVAKSGTTEHTCTEYFHWNRKTLGIVEILFKYHIMKDSPVIHLGRNTEGVQ